MDAEDLIIATKKRISKNLARFPSAFTRSRNSNLFKLLYSLGYENEYLWKTYQDVLDSRDIITLTNNDPTGISPHLDTFSAPLQLSRYGDTTNYPESNAKYRTRLITHRHIRLSDGSVADIANYIYALTGLPHPDAGAVPVYDENGAIISISRIFPRAGFIIHEAWNYIPPVYNPDGDIKYIVPPLANFTSLTNVAHEGGYISFQDTSLYYPTAWFWDFGDGHYSYEECPIHQYELSGKYTVTLQVSNQKGTSTEIKRDYILILPPIQMDTPEWPSWEIPPLPSIQVSPLVGIAPLTIECSEESGLEADVYEWDFGDGEKSSEPATTHTYGMPGRYMVTLSVQNDEGSSTINQYVTVIDNLSPPEADFLVSSAEGTVPFTVTFINRSVGYDLHYLWDFGDGTTSKEVNPTHTFTSHGNYTVTLTASNSSGIGTQSLVIHSNAVQRDPVPYPPDRTKYPVHCFWIEFLEPTIFPLNLDLAVEGINRIKAAGVCFRGFEFNTHKINSLAGGSATLSPDLECRVPFVGGVTCIDKISHTMRWGPDPWGDARWGYVTDDICNNTCYFLLLDNMSASPIFGDTPSNAHIYYDVIFNACHTKSSYKDSYIDIDFKNLPTSMRAGGVFCTYEGYGYGGYTTTAWDYYVRDYFNTSWRDVLITTGLHPRRRKPYTSDELSPFTKKVRQQKERLSEQGWISVDGIFHQQPWGWTRWGSTKWEMDLSRVERENDAWFYLEVSLYCPTTYLGVYLPAPHVRCPKPANLRDKEQIELDCIFVSDDSAILFQVEEKPMGVAVETEWITFQ